MLHRNIRRTLEPPQSILQSLQVVRLDLAMHVHFLHYHSIAVLNLLRDVP